MQRCDKTLQHHSKTTEENKSFNINNFSLKLLLYDLSDDYSES